MECGKYYSVPYFMYVVQCMTSMKQIILGHKHISHITSIDTQTESTALALKDLQLNVL